MAGTLAFMIAVSTLFFTVILSLLGALNIIALVSLMILFNILQWLFAPHLINALYKAQEVSKSIAPSYTAWLKG